MKTVAATLVLIWFGTAAVAGQLIFNTPTPLRTSDSGSNAVASGDFNGDTLADVVIFHPRHSVEVLLGGRSRFSASVVTATSDAYLTDFVVVDFDRDGKLDLVLRSEDPRNVTVMLGNGDGSFHSGATLPVSAGGGLAVADFNGDALPDIVIGRDVPTPDLLVYLALSSGGFSAPVSTSAFAHLRSLAVGDFNLDGKQDLIICGGGIQNTEVRLGAGDGKFSGGSAVGAAGDTVSADFNHDGKLDLAVAVGGTRSNYVEIDLGSGTGTFERKARIPIAFGDGGDIVTVDLNHDSNPDLLVATGRTTAVLIGNADGTFRPVRSYVNGLNGYQIVTGDFDGDGNVDVVTVDYNDAPDISFVRGRGDGTLDTSSALPVRELPDDLYPGPSPNCVGLADVDHDGRLDIVTTVRTMTDWSVIVLRNSGATFGGPSTVYTSGQSFVQAGPPFLLGDVNRDGFADLIFGGPLTLFGNADGTFSAVTTQSGQTQIGNGILADANGDGQIDVLAGSSGSIYTGSGDGKFTPAVSLPASGGFFADANADGRPDFFSASGVFINDGSGRFSLSTKSGPLPDLLGAADLNGDGRADAIGYTNTLLSVRLANADGSFAPAIVTAVNSETVTAGAQVADFDGDGRQDLLLGTEVLLGNGDGSWRAYSHARHHPGSAAVGDIDGNGTLDLIIANRDSGTINVLTTRLAGDGILPATLSLQAFSTPSYSGSPLRLEATIARSTLFGTTGAVRFADGDRTIGFDRPRDTAAVTTRLLVGTHLLSATLTGDEFYQPVSASTTITTVPAQIRLDVSSQNPSNTGKPASFRVNPTIVNGQFTQLTGTISIREGSTLLASATPAALGATVLTISFPTAGVHNLTISYSGDAEVAPVSQTLEQYVGTLATQGTASVSTKAPALGENVTLRATLICCATYAGTVTFSDNGTTIGTTAVTGSEATLVRSFTTVGLHTIEAFYSGDATFSPLKMKTVLYIAAPPKRRVGSH